MPTSTPNTGMVQETTGGWRLHLSAGPAGSYRLAQLDDYAHLRRSSFPWQPPCSLEIQARSSSADPIPGTWGFGFWNDPFSLSLGLGGGTRRLPTLPNAAWFFFASPSSYLSLRDDLPAEGALAATFRSPHLTALLAASGALFLPLLAVPALGRVFRRLARRFIVQDAAPLHLNVTDQHLYRIDWLQSEVLFQVDGRTILLTTVVPKGPLGLVLWIDNQFAGFTPDGHFRFGTLANPTESWVEISVLSLHSQGLGLA